MRLAQLRNIAKLCPLRYPNTLKLQVKGIPQFLFLKNGCCGIVKLLKKQQNEFRNFSPLKGRQKCCALKSRNYFLPFSPSLMAAKNVALLVLGCGVFRAERAHR